MGLIARLLEPDIQRHLLVEEDERVIDEVRKHWVVSLPWIGVMCLSIPAFVFMTAVRGFFWVPMLVGLYLLGLGFWKAHVAHMDRFVITNMRVFRIHGVFNTHLATMPMTRILDISLEQPVLGKVFDYGHLVFESAAQAQGLPHDPEGYPALRPPQEDGDGGRGRGRRGMSPAGRVRESACQLWRAASTTCRASCWICARWPGSRSDSA